MTGEASSKALLVVDVQNDFCEGGSLAVVGGDGTAHRIAEFLRSHQDEYAATVATRDHHVDPGTHFSTHPDFIDTWPTHCVVGTPGAAIHHALSDYPFDAVFDKGEHAAAYSGFEGVSSSGQSLDAWLADHGIKAVDVVGIATDYCVRATAVDAQASGYRTRVLLDHTSGVANETTQQALKQMRDNGVQLIFDASAINGNASAR